MRRLRLASIIPEDGEARKPRADLSPVHMQRGFFPPSLHGEGKRGLVRMRVGKLSLRRSKV